MAIKLLIYNEEGGFTNATEFVGVCWLLHLTGSLKTCCDQQQVWEQHLPVFLHILYLYCLLKPQTAPVRSSLFQAALRPSTLDSSLWQNSLELAITQTTIIIHYIHKILC